MERQTLQQQVPVYHVCQECGGDGCPVCSDLCIVEGDFMPTLKPLFAYRPTCPFCGEFMSGDGHTQVLHCHNTLADYDSFEPDASPVYCYQDEA